METSPCYYKTRKHMKKHHCIANITIFLHGTYRKIICWMGTGWWCAKNVGYQQRQTYWPNKSTWGVVFVLQLLFFGCFWKDSNHCWFFLMENMMITYWISWYLFLINPYRLRRKYGCFQLSTIWNGMASQLPVVRQPVRWRRSIFMICTHFITFL